MRLSEKTCVVTGAARGIGRAIAEAFHREGATVIATDKDLAAVTDMAAALGARAFPLDVRREEDWDALARFAPSVDVVVNNAGVTGFEDGPRPHDPETASLADWRAVHAVNLDGTFLGCRYAIRVMKARGIGSIVNISSRSGRGRLRVLEGRHPQSHQERGAPLRSARLGHPLQLHPPGRDPDPDVGADARRRP